MVSVVVGPIDDHLIGIIEIRQALNLLHLEYLSPGAMFLRWSLWW